MQHNCFWQILICFFKGEQVQILDVLSNNIMKRRLLATGLVCMMCSEEEDAPIYPDVCNQLVDQLNSICWIDAYNICVYD